MKKIILVFALAISVRILPAQDVPAAQIPSPVVKALSTAYPKAEKTKWKVKDDLYHADFEIGKDDYDVWLDKTGKIVKRKYDVPASALPAGVAATLKKDYSEYTVDDVVKTEAKGGVTYKVELKKAGEKRKITFGEDGKIVEKKED